MQSACGQLLPRESGVAVIDVSARPTDVRLLAAVLQNSSDAIVFVDERGMVSRWNDAAEKMFGFSENGAFEELFPSEWREEMADVLVRASLGQSVRATPVAVRSDGSRLIVETTCSAVTGFNGAAPDYVVLLKDVTESILVRASAAAVAFAADASAALESLALVLGYVTPVENLTLTAMEGRGTVRRVASAGRCAARLQTGELLPTAGTPLAVGIEHREPIVCYDTSTGDLPYDAVLAKSGVGSYVVLPLFHGGRIAATLNIGFAAPGVPTPSVVGLLSSLAASVMPTVLNVETLEEQAVAIRQLEHLDELKNELLALITHDMRTPLAVIAGFAEQLENRWTELSDVEKLESVDAILRNTRSLSRLTEEGLEIARVESGELAYELRRVSLEDEVNRTVADLATADADRIHVSAEQWLPLVRCDPDRHRQILMNLLSNALKFSPPDSSIEVRLNRRQSVVQVAVRDHGPGIERSDLSKLFQRFSRVGTQQLAPGTGLGLYVSKAMVEAQGGHMSVQSEPGRGSTFVYTLPATEAGAG